MSANSNRKSRAKFTPVANRAITLAAKAAESTFEYLTTNHMQSSILETQQSLNHIDADISLMLRETQRGLSRSSRFNATGIDDNIIERALGWLGSHLLYVLHLIWGYISPILMQLAWNLFSIIFIIAVNIICFGGLYLLLTS